jgi:hypothetical protein
LTGRPRTSVGRMPEPPAVRRRPPGGARQPAVIGRYAVAHKAAVRTPSSGGPPVWEIPACRCPGPRPHEDQQGPTH